MIQEDKQLLLKDLCARLSYFDNWIQYEGKDYIVTGYGHGRVSLLPSLFSSGVGPCPLIEEVKPYLRPLSSMTEDEKEELEKNYVLSSLNFVVYKIHQHKEWYGGDDEECTFSDYLWLIDWLNAHHFDYRGLIEKWLALEAPEGMYKQ